jgi:hypothetical protein
MKLVLSFSTVSIPFFENNWNKWNQTNVSKSDQKLNNVYGSLQEILAIYGHTRRI